MSEKLPIVIKSELSPLKEEKKKFKFPPFVSLILRFLLVALVSIILGANVQVIYCYSRYQKFYVNGESMYPTLNRDTKVYDLEGNDVTPDTITSLSDFDRADRIYTCDYGLMDTTQNTIHNLERFDLAVTYYGSDFIVDASGNPLLKSGSSLKIKRIIALPNEEAYFDEKGDLYIKEANKEEFAYFHQPFLEKQSDWDDSLVEWVNKYKPDTVTKSNPNIRYGTKSNPIVLKDGEYFLVGDNRMNGKSHDSRQEGAIPFYAVIGKAVVVTAKCKFSVERNDSGELSFKQEVIPSSILMPWDYRYL